jgi:hypothetical protein
VLHAVVEAAADVAELADVELLVAVLPALCLNSSQRGGRWEVRRR